MLPRKGFLIFNSFSSPYFYYYDFYYFFDSIFLCASREKKHWRVCIRKFYRKAFTMMKIIFNRQVINDAVAPLMYAVSGKSTLSAIEGILIDAQDNNTCVLTTFDLEKGMRVTVDAEVEESGTYIINAQKFAQTIRVMEGDSITLTVDDTLQACISSGKSNHRMKALAGSDYPVIPRLTTEDGFVIGQALLKHMLSKIMYAMASNDQRPVLNGCYCKVSDDSILMVSCDSFKLAKCMVETDIDNKNEDASALKFSFIMPTKTVNELFKLLRDDERESVRIYMSRKNIVFHIGNLIFFSRLIEGQYIDFDRILVNNHRIEAVVPRDAMIAALERASLITEEKVAGSVRSHVRLDFADQMLKISATSTMGSTYDELEIEHNGDDLLIAFNNRFLIDTLRAGDSAHVKISMTSALTGINIEPVEADENVKEIFMLLPIRMKE